MSKIIINSFDQQQLEQYNWYIKYLPFSDCVNSTADLMGDDQREYKCVVIPFGDIHLVVKKSHHATCEYKEWRLATFLESNQLSPNSITVVDAMLEENKFLCTRIHMEIPNENFNVMNRGNDVLTPEDVKVISRKAYCEHITSPFRTSSNNELYKPTVKTARATHFNIDKKLIH